ncbi:unnamed protein product [Rotaria socialis]
MSKDNNDFHLQSNTLPPCSQTCSNSSRARPSRPSSGNRILHGTLSSPSSSLSKVAHRRRNLSSPAFLDFVFHADLTSNKDDYETAKQIVMKAMQQIDLIVPGASGVPSLTESRGSSSTTNGAPIMRLKSNLMSITRKNPLPSFINSAFKCRS